MTRLFDAGFVDRFRPQTLRGSYQWTYCLARDGFRAAEQTGELAPGLKFAPRREAIFDYRYVIHDLRVNEWVLRYRELLGDRLLDWAGPDESLIQPPKGITSGGIGDGEYDVIGIEDEAMRSIQPDARLDVVGVSGEVSLFVEYDRTRRVDKNYDKFRRYEAFLAGWWHGALPEGDTRRRSCSSARTPTTASASSTPPTGSSLPTSSAGELNPAHEYVVRDRVLFAIEDDMHNGHAEAVRLPHDPPSVRDPTTSSASSGSPDRRRREINPCPPVRSLRRVPSWRVRPERYTRPDPPTPEITDAACPARGRGSTASRWTPFLDMPDTSGRAGQAGSGAGVGGSGPSRQEDGKSRRSRRGSGSRTAG